MTFCQSCGAQNSEDARFCNMCGAAIARAGESGGPIGEPGKSGATLPGMTSPPGSSTSGTIGGPTHSTMSGSSISLDAIGVRSARATWAVLIGGGLLLFGLGALGMWIAMSSGSHEAAAPETEVEEPEIALGDPIPAGEIPPDDLGFVTGDPRVTHPTEPSARSSGSRTPAREPARRPTGGSRTAASGGSEGRGSAGSGAASGTGGGSGGSAGSGSSSAGSGSAGSGSGGSGGSSASGEPPDTSGGEPATGSGGAGGSGAGGGNVDWDSLAGENTSPEEELEEAYSLQVRRVIRSYYIQRARSCFDHASRTTQESVRGTVVIGFTITQSGQIANTEVVRNSTGSDSLAACLSQQVAAWRLPPPPRSMGEVPMQMPFGS